MRCPRCEAPLAARPAGRKATMHECPERHGVHLDKDALRHALPVAAHAALTDAMARSVPGHAPCAGCGDAMRTLHPRGVELDGCPSCGGVWFDGGELERVKRPPGPAAGPAASAERPRHSMALAGGADALAAAPVALEGLAGVFQVIAAMLDW